MTTIYGLLTLNPNGGLLPNSTISVWRQSPSECGLDDLMFVIPVSHQPEDLVMLSPAAQTTCGHVYHPITQLAIDRDTRRRRLLSPPPREWGHIRTLTPKVSIIRMPLYPMTLRA